MIRARARRPGRAGCRPRPSWRSQPPLQEPDEDQPATEQEHGQQQRKLELAAAPEALGQQNQDHHDDGADEFISHEGLHDRAPADYDSARDYPQKQGDRGDDKAVHSAASPSFTTSWWMSMTSRSASIPRAKVF